MQSRRRRHPSRNEPGQRTVLHLTTTDISLDLLLLPQLTAFTRAGFRVIGASAPGPHTEKLKRAGIEHLAIPSFTRSSNPLRDVRAAFELVQVVRRLRPDIVHTHNPKPGVIGRPIARLLGVPLVVNTQHGLYAQPSDHWTRRWPVYLVERLAAAFSHIELVQNPEDAELLTGRLRVPTRRVRLLGNGIDMRRFDPSTVDASLRVVTRRSLGIPDDACVVGAVCRLTREKGVSELLTAFEQVRRSAPNTRFVVVGPDEASNCLRATIDRARSAGVVFTGLRTDMPECYAAMDIFVTATWREGFPRSAMEACAMGVPVIATNIRGCRQVVEDGHTGCLVPARNPESLAAAINELVADPDLRLRLGRAARSKALQEFDDRLVVERTLDAYAMLGR